MLLLAVVAVAVAGGGLTWWLLSIAAADPNASASVQIDAIRTGLSAAVGTGGAFALLLAFRRQRSTEVSAVHTITDATERRVTELYTKAADQLGSDKAPVRLAGLYALERLAQDNPDLTGARLVGANLTKAYLREAILTGGQPRRGEADQGQPRRGDPGPRLNLGGADWCRGHGRPPNLRDTIKTASEDAEPGTFVFSLPVPWWARRADVKMGVGRPRRRRFLGSSARRSVWRWGPTRRVAHRCFEHADQNFGSRTQAPGRP